MNATKFGECPENSFVENGEKVKEKSEKKKREKRAKSAKMSVAEKNGTFLSNLRLFLEKHKLKEVESLFEEHLSIIANDSELMWDVVPIICSRLKTLNEFRFKTFGACQEMLLKLTAVCKPKEILIALLAELENENLEMSDDCEQNVASNETTKKYQSKDNCFKAVMKPLETILIKLPTKRNETLKWVLNTLNNHLLKISPPRDYHLDPGKERLFLDSDASVKRFNLLLPFYLDFLTTFVDELETSSLKFNSNRALLKTNNGKYADVPQRDILLTALLSLLFHPFVFLDLSLRNDLENICNFGMDSKTKSKLKCTQNNDTQQKSKNCSPNNYAHISRVCGSIPTLKPICNSVSTCDTSNLSESLFWSMKTVELISKLEPNMFNVYERIEHLMEPKDMSGNDFKIKSEAVNYSLATQAYITLGLNWLPNRNFVPSVYSHLYVFQKHLPLINCLIERKECFICEKGLVLGEKLISRLGCFCLNSSFLDCLKQHPLDKTLIKIMRLSSVKAHRQQALRIFTFLIYSFTNPGRYQIIYTTLAEPGQHAGVKGFVLGLYKDLIAKESEISVFIGLNLHRIIRKAISCCLPEGTESDLLENSDSILALLNLIRFLTLRDRKENNETLIWNIIDTIKNDFLKPLRKAIYLSRTHYKLELKMKEEKNKARSKSKVDVEVFATNNGDDRELIPKLPPDHERQVIKLALSNFDIIESVVVRIEDIVNE